MINISKIIITKKESKAVQDILDSGMLVQGPKVAQLERKFAKLCGTRYAIATNNGTSALHTALYSLGIGPGDEVITTPFTFVATANSVLMTGATPVFVDIEEDTFNLNPELIEEKITAKTKAILVVDLFGQPADYKEINEIAKKHNLLVIEDAAQSIGAKYFDKATGNLADISCFSLYATKNIISGEGGMITTNNNMWDQKARLFRQHGQDEKKRYEYFGLGYNFRMMDLQAAIAIEQLERIDLITKKRQEVASIYTKNLSGIKGLITPCVKNNRSSSYHQYTLRVTGGFKTSRDKFRNYLEGVGIETRVYYPKALYSFEHLKFNNCPKDFPVTEKTISEVLSIPINQFLSRKEIYYIIDQIKTYGK
jgi:perosamine synthetase